MLKPYHQIEETEEFVTYEYNTLYLYILYGILGMLAVGFFSGVPVLSVTGAILMVLYFLLVSIQYKGLSAKIKLAAKTSSVEMSGSKWSFSNPLRVKIKKEFITTNRAGIRAMKIGHTIFLFIAIVVIVTQIGKFGGRRHTQKNFIESVRTLTKNILSPARIDLLKDEDPIFLICATGSLKEVKENITQINVNIVSTRGDSPLLIASMHTNDSAIIEYLINCGADKNAETSTGTNAIMVASRRNPNPEIINKLVSLGFDVNSRSSQTGKTPLMYAANYNDDPAILKALINNGADVNLKSLEGLYKGDNALAFVCRFFSANKIAKAKILIENGINIDNQNEFGDTALIIAAKSDIFNKEIITFLYQADADISLRDKEGRTASDYFESYEISDLYINK